MKGFAVNKIIVLLFILLSTNACADWFKFGENSAGTVFFADPLTKKGGSQPRVWIYVIYGKTVKSKNRSYRALTEANCTNGTARDLTTIYYFDNDFKNINYINNVPEQWIFPAPQTADEAIYIYLYGKDP